MQYGAGVGCADLHTEGWVRQGRDSAMIVCNATGHVWQLTCEGNSWVGPLLNCSQGKCDNDNTST